MDGSILLPRTHNALNDFYQLHFREAVQRGDQIPYVWPYRSFGTYVLLAYLLLPPTKSRVVRYAFYPTFAFFSYWSWKTMIETKSASMAIGYLIGIANSWAALWIASRTIFTDYRTATRIERQSHYPAQKATAVRQDVSNLSPQTRDAFERRRVGGRSKREDTTTSSSPHSLSQTRDGSYYWQTLPSRFSERLDFIIDLLCSMRGPGWAHQARSIPGPPEYIASQLKPHPLSTKSVVREYKDRQSLLRANMIRILKFQIYLDIIKTLMTYDPYFLGFVEPTPPAPTFFPALIRDSPVLTKSYRLVLALFATRIALGMIFCLSPIFFSGVLGPKVIGLRAESWYYSDFGGDWQYLLSHGIAGWWGAWWHQMFRLGFEAPSKWACEKLGLPQRSVSGKTATLLIVFACSGIVHAFGSMNMYPETKPWSGPFLFFMLQAVGVLLESVLTYGLETTGITQRTPQTIKKIVMVIWLATWIYYTGPVLIDDFSRGGVWLFEPIPFSILKMLGFGEENDHWWRWRARNIFWYSGGTWWKSGIAL